MSMKVIPHEEFAKNLIYYYKKKGVTQKEIADVVGVSTGTVCDWCKGRLYPRMDKIQKLAEYLGCEKSDLIEERHANNSYYVKKESDALYNEIVNDPDSMELYKKIKRLTHEDRLIVEGLLSRLQKEDER